MMYSPCFYLFQKDDKISMQHKVCPVLEKHNSHKESTRNIYSIEYLYGEALYLLLHTRAEGGRFLLLLQIVLRSSEQALSFCACKKHGSTGLSEEKAVEVQKCSMIILAGLNCRIF